MKVPPTCPRCGRPVRAPDLWSSSWRCDRHGDVQPFHVVGPLAPEGMAALTRIAQVPLWVPHPMMPGWVVTGLGYCGDERVGARATVLCCSGPAPLGGPGDLVLVAEEPGVGVGVGYAGLSGTDPGDLTSRSPEAKVDAAGHPTALWSVDGSDDRAVFAAEGRGMWLWAVLWPSNAGVLFIDDIALADAREFGPAAYEMLGYGAPSPRISERSVQPD
jgi:hypothetical protein